MSVRVAIKAFNALTGIVILFAMAYLVFGEYQKKVERQLWEEAVRIYPSEVDPSSLAGQRVVLAEVRPQGVPIGPGETEIQNPGKCWQDVGGTLEVLVSNPDRSLEYKYTRPKKSSESAGRPVAVSSSQSGAWVDAPECESGYYIMEMWEFQRARQIAHVRKNSQFQNR